MADAAWAVVPHDCLASAFEFLEPCEFQRWFLSQFAPRVVDCSLAPPRPVPSLPPSLLPRPCPSTRPPLHVLCNGQPMWCAA